MKPLARLCIGVAFSLGALGWSGSHSALLAQNVQVTSATPASAAQGTINLNVVIGGSGFKKGAQAQWFITGTTNPGGVVVNSTAFNSSSQLTANITVADTATIASFDVLVYSGGRTGKGTGLFAVTSSGNPQNGGCTTLGTPSGFSLVSQLNYLNPSGAPQYGPRLGHAIRVRPVVLTSGNQSKTVLVTAVATKNTTGKLEIFFLDPATGNVLDDTVIVGTQVQPHITVAPNAGGHIMETGDVDGNGIPDFVIGDPNNAATVTMGYEDPVTGIISYSPTITIPRPPSNLVNGGWAIGVAMGNLDGNPSGENVIVGGPIGATSGTAGAVYVYQFNGSRTSPVFTLIGTVNDPIPNQKNDDQFGYSVATGEVTGNGAASLIVGAPNATVSRITNAGRVFVFPAPLSSPTTYYTLAASPVKGALLGDKLGSGTLSTTTATDVIAYTGYNSTVPSVTVFKGPITSNRTSANIVFSSYPGVTAPPWVNNADVGDMSGDGWADFVVGMPDSSASGSSCNASVGTAELYLSSVSGSGPTWSVIPFETPVIQNDYMGFGWGVGFVGAVPGVIGSTPLLVVGEQGRDLGGVTSAGQVYVYKKN